jgi:hypothetical protein
VHNDTLSRRSDQAEYALFGMVEGSQCGTYVFYLFPGDGLFLFFYFSIMFKFLFLFVCYLVLIARRVLNYKLFTPGLSRLKYRLTILSMFVIYRLVVFNLKSSPQER